MEKVVTHPKHLTKVCGCWQDHPKFKDIINDFDFAIRDWEEKECIPVMETSHMLLKLRGGVAEKLYYRLIQTALETKKLPDFVSEASDDDDVFVKKRKVGLRGVTSPTKRSDDREEEKQLIMDKASHHPEIIDKIREWRAKCTALWKVCGDKGYVPIRTMDGKSLKCENIGKAISLGRKKAKEARERHLMTKGDGPDTLHLDLPSGKSMKVQVPSEDHMKAKMEIEVLKNNIERLTKDLNDSRKHTEEYTMKWEEEAKAHGRTRDSLSAMSSKYAGAHGELKVLRALMMNDKGINLSTQPSKSYSRSPDSEASEKEFDIRLSQLQDPNSYVYKH